MVWAILTICLLDYVAGSLSEDSDSNFDGYINEDEDIVGDVQQE